MSDEFLWQLARVVDIIHVAIVIPLMIAIIVYMQIGKRETIKALGGVFVSLVLGLQAVFLNCPLVMLSRWLRSFSQPDIDGYEDSFVHWLYEQIGVFAHLHWLIAASAFAFAGYQAHLYIRLRKARATPRYVHMQ